MPLPSSFPYAPHLLLKKKMIFTEAHDSDPCHLTLHARLSPTTHGHEPAVYANFRLYDNTRVTLPSPYSQDGKHYYYALQCPLTNKPITLLLHAKSSRRAVGAMIPPDFPIEQCHRVYFDFKILGFVREVMEAAGAEYNVTMYIVSSVERMVEADKAAGLVRKIEYEIAVEEIVHRKVEVEVEEEREVCANCFEEVELSWFRGVRLACSHEFHLCCVAPLLREHNSCPMCGRPQPTHLCMTG